MKSNKIHIDICDQELNINDRLKQSHSTLDDLISQGTMVLSSLREQHMDLRGVKRNVLDIGQRVIFIFLVKNCYIIFIAIMLFITIMLILI